MMQEQLWVIAYDTPCNKLRRKLAKLLKGYGERLQRSVFECRLQPHQVACLRQGLERIAAPQDSVRLWQLSARSPQPLQFGCPVEPIPWRDKVI